MKTSDPALAGAIRAHAGEVSGFVHDGMPAMMEGMMGVGRYDGTTVAARDHEMTLNQYRCEAVIFDAVKAGSDAPRNGYLRRFRLASRCNAARKRADSSGLICSRKWLSTSSELPPASNTSRMSWALCCSRVNVGQYR